MNRPCTVCGSEITTQRLASIPWTTVCVLCALEMEVQSTQIMARTTEYIASLRALSESLTGASELTEGTTTEQAADERANNLLCRQIDRLEGFEES